MRCLLEQVIQIIFHHQCLTNSVFNFPVLGRAFGKRESRFYREFRIPHFPTKNPTHKQVDNENIVHINILTSTFSFAICCFFSGHKFIHLLALCLSSIIKVHSKIILQYISHRVNKYIDRQFYATIAQQTIYCKI